MKTVFITGASKGIGKETVRIFADKGWNVIAAMRNLESESIFGAYDNIIPVQCDVNNEESIKDAMIYAITLFDKIDVLVNNAGIYITKPIESTNYDEIDDIINTNIKGVIRCTKLVIPHFRENRNGIIINISSVADFATFPFQSIYHTSKWGIEGFSESLHYELKYHNIKVKIVEPGVIKTNLYDNCRTVEGIHPAYHHKFSIWHSNLIKNIDSGYSPIISARSIYKAATDNANKLRYRSGSDTKIAALLRYLLPINLFFLVVEKINKL